MENIENNINLPWIWNSVSKNSNLNIIMIENNMDKPWQWFFISKIKFIAV